METNKLYYLSLANTAGVGIVTFLKLLQHFGSAANVYNQDEYVLSNFVSKVVAQNILSNKSLEIVEKIKQWINSAPNRYIITLEDDLYPEGLSEIDSPPLYLFAEGNIELLKREDKLAIVGSRNPSVSGIENAKIFACELSKQNITIVSGLALGVDAIAHNAALNEIGGTIGVLGTGIDVVYPKSNSRLFLQMKQNGLVLSEFGLGVQPLMQNFPRRNRIVVGLAKACLVIESAIDGGSMISARFALDYGRDVLAIPGSIHNPLARGCHKLIKQGAKLVETAREVVEEITNKKYNPDLHSNNSMPKDKLLEIMGFEPITIDKLCNLWKLDFAEACGRILEYELANQIVNCGGGKYQRLK